MATMTHVKTVVHVSRAVTTPFVGSLADLGLEGATELQIRKLRLAAHQPFADGALLDILVRSERHLLTSHSLALLTSLVPSRVPFELDHPFRVRADEEIVVTAYQHTVRCFIEGTAYYEDDADASKETDTP